MKYAGYDYLIQELNLLVPPLDLRLAVGDKKEDIIQSFGANKIKLLAKTRKVGTTTVEHIETAIQHQGIRLQYLVPIFKKIDITLLTEFIKERPASSIRRCIWYLYEWLEEDQLDIPNSTKNYTNLLDERYYFTLDKGIRNSRTRVINNLIGTKDFCPIIRKTPEILAWSNKNLMDLALAKLIELHELVNPETLGRSSSYLYTKETKSSTDIEKEDSHTTKTEKFYRVLTSSGQIPLSKARLVDIQNKIVRTEKKDTDYRSDEIYVGESRPAFGGGIEENIHYIGPKQDTVEGMMRAWLEVHDMILFDQHLPAMIHAAILSFSFVYIHPFSDGNGRIHRYLIHDILKLRHSSEDYDFIIPVSATILNNQSAYDKILEKISKPIMALLDYDLNPEDNSITINNDLDYLYRYPDLTPHVMYLYEMMETSMSVDLVKEVSYIIKYDVVKDFIEDYCDIPNKELDLLIKFFIQNDGEVANKKRKRFYKWIPEDKLIKLEKHISDLLNDVNASTNVSES